MYGDINLKYEPLVRKEGMFITSDFGWRVLNGLKDYHIGIDLRATVGTQIKAVNDGIVTAVRNSVTGFNAYLSEGNYVIIRSSNGVESLYFHMRQNSITVKVGDKVTHGKIIGEVGYTGNVYGAHLHISIRVNGTFVDPKPYLQGTKSMGNVDGRTAKLIKNAYLYKQDWTGKYYTTFKKGSTVTILADDGYGMSKVKIGSYVGYIYNNTMNDKKLSKCGKYQLIHTTYIYGTTKDTKAKQLKVNKADKIAVSDLKHKGVLYSVDSKWARIDWNGKVKWILRKRIKML